MCREHDAGYKWQKINMCHKILCWLPATCSHSTYVINISINRARSQFASNGFTSLFDHAIYPQDIYSFTRNAGQLKNKQQRLIAHWMMTTVAGRDKSPSKVIVVDNNLASINQYVNYQKRSTVLFSIPSCIICAQHSPFSKFLCQHILIWACYLFLRWHTLQVVQANSRIISMFK